MKIITTTLMAFGLVAVALYFIPPRCVQIPIGAWLRKAPVMPPSDGGSDTLESVLSAGAILTTDHNPTPLTMAWAPRSISDSQGFTGHVITQAEAEEVRTIIRDSLNAHNFALDFYKTAVVAFKAEGDQEAILKNIGRVTQSATRLLEFEAKWRKRVEEGKP